MLLTELGEFALIERFRRKIKTDSSVVKGSGDDCAVLKLDKDNYQLFTCDMIVEGVDFTLKDDAQLIGRKALAISISDIASCAGTPRHAVVSLGMPKKSSLKLIEGIAKGLFDLARQYKINIVGGDISAADKIIIDVSMLGVVKKSELCLRVGAQVGDIIFVTGSLGNSIKGKHLKFNPRLKEARFLARNFRPSAMMDISDGLVQDLGHILRINKVGAKLEAKVIPLSREAKGLADALYSGEEFELLFTLRPKEADKLIRKTMAIYKPIGQIMPHSYGLKLLDKGKEKKLLIKGYQHF